MPFDKMLIKDVIIGDKAVMYAPWTPLPPKLVTIFSITDDVVKVVAEDDTVYEFSTEKLERKTNTGYVWELRKYDKKKFAEYSYKLEELVEIRKLKKELDELMNNIKDSWHNIQDVEKLQRALILVDILKHELGVL